jgi:S-adenosylmethionine:tRNA ribosyltransferase-isomerase
LYVGTTSMRAVESSVSSHGTLNPFDGWTNKFVFLSSWFTIPTCMITNFHAKIYFINDGICILWTWLNEKSLWRSNEEYKFYSYGDAMLII